MYISDQLIFSGILFGAKRNSGRLWCCKLPGDSAVIVMVVLTVDWFLCRWDVTVITGMAYCCAGGRGCESCEWSWGCDGESGIGTDPRWLVPEDFVWFEPWGGFCASLVVGCWWSLTAVRYTAFYSAYTSTCSKVWCFLYLFIAGWFNSGLEVNLRTPTPYLETLLVISKKNLGLVAWGFCLGEERGDEYGERKDWHPLNGCGVGYSISKILKVS